MKGDPLFIEVLVALGAGNMSMGPIHADGEYIHGFMSKGSGAVRINPAPEVCDTVLHELIHRLRPRWSEQTVRSRTAKMRKAMTDAEIDKLYELVQVVAKVRKRAVRIDVD